MVGVKGLSPDVVQCPGCQRRIDLARPEDVPVAIGRDQPVHRRDVVTISIGRIVVHRCVLCADGEWR